MIVRKRFFYCDPPYPHDSRKDVKAYAFEMTDDDHRQLAKVLHSTRGKVAISSYQSPLMSELYGDWICIEGPSRKINSVKKIEVNYYGSIMI